MVDRPGMEDARMIELYDQYWCFGSLDESCRRLGESGEYIPLKGVKWIASGRYK